MKNLSFTTILVFLIFFSSCVSVDKLNRGEVIQEAKQAKDKKYSLYLYTTQGCGYCLVSMRFLKQTDFCSNPNISLVVVENFLQDYNHNKELRYELDYYPECAKIILADKVAGRISKSYPKFYFVNNEDQKIVKTVVGYFREEIEAAIESLSQE